MGGMVLVVLQAQLHCCFAALCGATVWHAYIASQFTLHTLPSH
jgi:hypothetical protein